MLAGATIASEEILAAAQPLARGRPDLKEHLFALSRPAPRPDWEIKNERRRQEREQKKANAWTQHRKDFSDNVDKVRRGELRWSLPASQAYLGLFTDIDKNLAPPDRIGEWLGPELQAAALHGIGVVLDRPDLPSPEQLAEDYAQSRRWNFVLPMIACAAERIRLNRSLAELSREQIIALRIALQHEALGDRFDTERLTAELESELRKDPALFERYVRLLIEPSLKVRAQHIVGLYAFLRVTG